MAGKTAVLSVRIVSDAQRGILGLNKTANAVRNLQKAARNARSDMVNFVGSTPKIAMAATGVTTLAAAALAGTSNVLALGASLASIAGAALLLPGALAFGGVALGVLMAAMKDAGTVLADLGPKFSALQDSISTNYWAQAAEPIRSLANSVLPTLNTALSNTATIMGSGMATAANTLKSALAGSLGPIMSDINTGLHEANGAIQPFIEGMVTLTRVGAEYMPALGRGIADMGAAFGAWVSQAAAAGDLNRWIDNGLQGLKDLGSVVGSTVGILGGLATAAANAGGAGLGALADGLARVNEAVNGPFFQGALTEVFTGAHQAIANLGPGLSAFATSLGTLAPTLSEIMAVAGLAASALLTGLAAALSHPAFAGGAEMAFNGILVGITALQPAIAVLGPVVGALLTTFGTLAATVLPIVAQLFVALAPAVIALAAALQPVIIALGTSLAAALAVIVPPLTSFAVSVLPAIGTAVQVLAPVIVGFAAVWAAQWVIMATMATANAIRMAAAWVIAMGPVGWVIAAVVGLVVLVVANWDRIKSATISAWSAVAAFVVSAWSRLKSATASGIAAVASFVVSGMSRVVSSFSSAWSRAVSLVTSAFSRIVSAVSSGVSNVMSFVGSLPGRIVGALAGLAGQLYSVGTNMMQGMVNGIRAMAGRIVSAATGAVSGAINAAKSLLGIRSPSRVFRKMGMQTGQGFIIGISKQQGAVQRATRDLLKVPQLTATALPAPEVSMQLRGSAGGTQSQPTVNNHHYYLSVNGTVVDRLGTAEAIDELLRERDRIMGGIAA